MNDEIKCNILYDHYKETVSYTKKCIDTRDRHFYYILFVMSLVTVLSTYPTDCINLIKGYLHIDSELNTILLNNIFLLALLYISHRYFQITINIEKSYPYIHLLEKKLSELSGEDDFITREGKTYLKGFSGFSKLTKYLYILIFPVGYICLLGTKAINDFDVSTISTVLCTFIIVMTILFMIFRVTQKKKDKTSKAEDKV